jgi:hypothetical protein
MDNSYVPMAANSKSVKENTMKRSRTALAVLLLTACAAAQERPAACNDALDPGGKTLQQTMDQMFDTKAADPRTPLYFQIFMRASKSYFDSLCTVDQLMDTQEAPQFVLEYKESMHRIATAEKSRKEAGGN